MWKTYALYCKEENLRRIVREALTIGHKMKEDGLISRYCVGSYPPNEDNPDLYHISLRVEADTKNWHLITKRVEKKASYEKMEISEFDESKHIVDLWAIASECAYLLYTSEGRLLSNTMAEFLHFFFTSMNISRGEMIEIGNLVMESERWRIGRITSFQKHVAQLMAEGLDKEEARRRAKEVEM